MRALAVSMAVVLTTATAIAQPAGALPDPARAALAHRLVEAIGGARQMEQLTNAALAAAERNSPPAQGDPAQAAVMRDVYMNMRGVFHDLAPRLVDIMADAYAANLTEPQLRDYLAFLQSDSGRAIVVRQPEIAAAVSTRVMPLIFGEMPRIMREAGEGACRQRQCTPEQHQQMIEAIERAYPSRPR